MVLFASLVPIYEEGFELHVEIIKALISFIDVFSMKLIYEWNATRVGDKQARMLGIGLGWAAAEAFFAHFLIFL